MSDNPYGASAVARAMAGSSQENAADAVSARRVMDERDFDREALGNLMYEKLRLKSKDELIEIARQLGLQPRGYGKMMLIGILIDRELHPDEEAAKMGPTHHPKEEG